MKNSIKNILGMLLLVSLLSFVFTGCYESQYYGHYHHHTREWYGHHHQTEPTGVNWDVDVDVHHH